MGSALRIYKCHFRTDFLKANKPRLKTFFTEMKYSEFCSGALKT